MASEAWPSGELGSEQINYMGMSAVEGTLFGWFERETNRKTHILLGSPKKQDAHIHAFVEKAQEGSCFSPMEPGDLPSSGALLLRQHPSIGLPGSLTQLCLGFNRRGWTSDFCGDACPPLLWLYYSPGVQATIKTMKGLP